MNALYDLWTKLADEGQKRQQKRGRADAWRPKLHITPPTGWLNDPNGLCQYKGVYHAFYQYAPFQVRGGLKFWGHCTSRDLLHWEFQGIPLRPDQDYDCHGAYSGSALAEEDGMYLFYTGNVKHMGDYDYVNSGRDSNTILAVSEDGMVLTGKSLLMANEDYPPDLTRHVRDPKVWKQDEAYYMLLGARTKEDKGVALVFSSQDRTGWKYIGRLQTEAPFGYMWECPDLFELDGQAILAVSPQGVAQDGLKYANKYQSGTYFLQGDFRSGAKLGGFRELDGGFDFYAPQSFRADDGRRILVGWMGLPDIEEEYSNKTVDDGWQNMLTVPRELFLQNGIVCQRPVRELDGWWDQETSFTGGYRAKTDTCYELELQMDGGDLEVILAGGLSLRYEKAGGIFRMEFTDRSLGAGRTMRGRRLERRLEKIKIFTDVSSVEVFINGGEDVFSTRFYPQADQYQAEIRGSGIKGRYRSRRSEDAEL